MRFSHGTEHPDSLVCNQSATGRARAPIFGTGTPRALFRLALTRTWPLHFFKSVQLGSLILRGDQPDEVGYFV
jgi:hypothetical protein